MSFCKAEANSNIEYPFVVIGLNPIAKLYYQNLQLVASEGPSIKCNSLKYFDMPTGSVSRESANTALQGIGWYVLQFPAAQSLATANEDELWLDLGVER